MRADGDPKPDGDPHSEPDDPPGAISDQNREEAQSGMREDETHPEPRTRDKRAATDRGDGD